MPGPAGDVVEDERDEKSTVRRDRARRSAGELVSVRVIGAKRAERSLVAAPGAPARVASWPGAAGAAVPLPSSTPPPRPSSWITERPRS
jgi:hypothetical protein